MSKPLKGYNPNRGGKAFNEDYGRKILSENCSDITDEQNEKQSKRLQDLIDETYIQLNASQFTEDTL
jgi:hypothetical protein